MATVVRTSPSVGVNPTRNCQPCQYTLFPTTVNDGPCTSSPGVSPGNRCADALSATHYLWLRNDQWLDVIAHGYLQLFRSPVPEWICGMVSDPATTVTL